MAWNVCVWRSNHWNNDLLTLIHITLLAPCTRSGKPTTHANGQKNIFITSSSLWRMGIPCCSLFCSFFFKGSKLNFLIFLNILYRHNIAPVIPLMCFYYYLFQFSARAWITVLDDVKQNIVMFFHHRSMVRGSSSYNRKLIQILAEILLGSLCTGWQVINFKVCWNCSV